MFLKITLFLIWSVRRIIIFRIINILFCVVKISTGIVDPDPYSGALWIQISIPNTDPDPHM